MLRPKLPHPKPHQGTRTKRKHQPW
ncbi:hypothetical protein A2U01_0082779, partial [Trifolium medium]|nr:hypothetical protein [Trifolium medium]